MSREDALATIEAVPNAGRREDAHVLLDMMTEASEEEPEVYGNTVGFGTYHYKYESGHEGDSYLVAFAPRKANMVVYIMPGFKPYADLMSKLGKFKTGASCLYLGRLKNVDLDVLRELVARSVADMRAKYHTGAD